MHGHQALGHHVLVLERPLRRFRSELPEQGHGQLGQPSKVRVHDEAAGGGEHERLLPRKVPLGDTSVVVHLDETERVQLVAEGGVLAVDKQHGAGLAGCTGPTNRRWRQQLAAAAACRDVELAVLPCGFERPAGAGGLRGCVVRQQGAAAGCGEC